MIKSLHIENYALISKLDIEFHGGFSVITGETGAGKSIILGAIGLLKGQRADMRSIKDGAHRCIVEALFDVSKYDLSSFFTDNDLDFDGSECIIRRELTSSGKSRAFVNDTPVSASLLKDLGERLLDVHSQHQNLLLNKEDFQINTLDIIACDTDLLTKYQSAYSHLRDTERKLQEARTASEQNAKDADYWRFQYEQLDNANLDDDNEQESLESESEMLEHAEEIRTALFTSHGIIDGSELSDSQDSVLDMLKRASQALASVASRYEGAAKLAERIDSCHIELKDIADETASCLDQVEADPVRLQEVDDRLNLIYTLERKHNCDSISELKRIRDKYAEKIDAVDNSDERISILEKEREAALKEAVALARTLTESRTQAAREAEALMTGSLKELGMPNVRFVISMTSDTQVLHSKGADHVAFLFSANKNSALQDLSKVASGGEIARVMLSLKSLIAKAVKLPTIIFDEIDTGVSGHIAEKMAQIMESMGREGRQVISITHLPQIAALGSRHYNVYKQDTDEFTETHIKELSMDERTEELAHMLSGSEITPAAIENARALLGRVSHN